MSKGVSPEASTDSSLCERDSEIDSEGTTGDSCSGIVGELEDEPERTMEGVTGAGMGEESGR